MLVLGIPPGPPPNRGPRPPPPPPCPPPPPPPPWLPVFPATLGPKPKVLVSRRFNTTCVGPVASLMGTILSPGFRRCVKCSQRRAVCGGRRRRRDDCRTRRGRYEARPIVEDGIVVEIIGCSDIERSARARHHERAQPKVIRQAERAAKKETVTIVKRGAAIIGADVVRVRGEAGNSRGIAVGVVQNVIAKKLGLSAYSNVGVDD